MTGRLAGKTAFITAAGQGIGRLLGFLLPLKTGLGK